MCKKQPESKEGLIKEINCYTRIWEEKIQGLKPRSQSHRKLKNKSIKQLKKNIAKF